MEQQGGGISGKVDVAVRAVQNKVTGLVDGAIAERRVGEEAVLSAVKDFPVKSLRERAKSSPPSDDGSHGVY